MRNFLSIKLKREFFKKNNLIMLLILPLVIAYVCISLDDPSRDTSQVYSVALIDHDNTESSSSLIKKIREYSEIQLSIEENLEQSIKMLARGKYDVVYEIKEGYQDKIRSGQFREVLIAHKEVNSTAVRWLNDQISLLVVRNWLYADTLSRTRNLNFSLSEADFQEKFAAAMADNKVLSLVIHNINAAEGLPASAEEPQGSYFFKILWAGILLYLIISFGKNIIDDRERGIIVRLKLAGFSRTKYYLANLLLLLFSCLLPFTISFFLMVVFGSQSIAAFLTDMILIAGYIISSWLVILFLGCIFNSKKGYNFAGQMFLLFSLTLGLGLLDKVSPIFKYFSWLFPLKWYFSFIS